MLRIAIVGNIASGKSVLENYLKILKFKVLDTDNVCHEILLNSDVIKLAFKDYDVFVKNKISRDKLGKLVFDNKDLKKQLEDLIYPELIEYIKAFFEQNKQEHMVFVAIPLLFEANMEDLFDKIVFVYCDDDIRLKRLIKRNNYSLDYAKKRLISQLSQDDKVKKSDYVIYNNSTIDEYYKQIDEVLNTIIMQNN